MQPTRYALLTLAALALPASAQAQRVSADIAIGSGPVSGRIVVGDPYYHPPVYHRPVYRQVVVVRTHRGYGWYRHEGYRSVRMYWDPARNSYYDRAWRPGLRAVLVYERSGRYYHDDRERFRDDRRYHRDDHDRDRNDYRDRTHDRYDDDR